MVRTRRRRGSLTSGRSSPLVLLIQEQEIPCREAHRSSSLTAALLAPRSTTFQKAAPSGGFSLWALQLSPLARIQRVGLSIIEHMRQNGGPLMRGHRSREVICASLACGELLFLAARVAHNGDRTTGPSMPQPPQSPADHGRGVFCREDYQGHPARRGVTHQVISPAVGDQTTTIQF